MPDWNDGVAPLRGSPDGKSWEGRIRKKPWGYRVSAAIVHRDTPEMLNAVVETLRNQTEAPYIIVADTGSGEDARKNLDALEASGEDIEVHYVRSRAWQTTSHPVTAAMDLITSLCKTEYMYTTHTDVFLKRPEYLEFLLGLCNRSIPGVGYQMSSRAKWGHQGWEKVLSHTGSMWHMPTLRQHSVTWNILAAFARLEIPLGLPQQCFPDTENNPAMVLEDAGFPLKWWDDSCGPAILCLGDEPNEPYETFWFTHVRSSSSQAIYNFGGELHQRRELLAKKATRSTRKLVQGWSNPQTKMDKASFLEVVNCPERGQRVDPETGARHWCKAFNRAVRLDPDCLHCKVGNLAEWSGPTGLLLQ